MTPEELEALRENYEERAAIMEYDGRLTREDAERAARLAEDEAAVVRRHEGLSFVHDRAQTVTRGREEPDARRGRRVHVARGAITLGEATSQARAFRLIEGVEGTVDAQLGGGDHGGSL